MRFLPRKFIFALTLVCLAIPPMELSAQETLPFIHREAAAETMLANFEKRHQSALAQLKDPYKKELAEQYQKRYDALGKIYRGRQFLTDTLATAYLQKLVNHILNANPQLRLLQPSIHFSRAWWPNAVSYGEGTIAFNISLFNRLQNEAQAAFVICHELAHLSLDHSNRNIREYVQEVNAPEFRQQLKDINKSEYQRNKRTDELLRGLSFTDRRHSRTHEYAADSMAIVLLQSTGYDLRESLSTLALLDAIDKEKHNGNLALKEQFHFAEYPFRARWTRAPSLTMSEARDARVKQLEENTDSLKTHPDCSKRIAALKPAVEKGYKASQQLFLVSADTFGVLANRFDAELVAYCLDAEAYGRALYYALQLFRGQPRNAWLATTIAGCLNRLYDAQKNHALGKVIDLPGSTRNKEYEEWLLFLQNVRLDELASVNYHFVKQQYPHFGGNADFKKEAEAARVNYRSHKQLP
ncbi:M48 family metalloprotease [Flavihumibacter sp.]|uniref:M48 family metalloprotease n=1 Tax=Flavihumibacter sp. TaxID=1913981 RepID=UPI002FC97879